MTIESPAQRPTAEIAPLAWRAAGEPDALPADPVLSGWLTDAGSLTARLKAACGARFRLELLGEAEEPAPADAAVLLGGRTLVRARRVRMYCGDTLCVGAATLIPAATLAAAPWLGDLGDRPLGEALLERGRVYRSSFRFAPAPATHPLLAPVLRGEASPAATLWARESEIRLAAGPLVVYEIFLPGLARCAEH